jgi:hypothetical protein
MDALAVVVGKHFAEELVKLLAGYFLI